MKVMDLKIDQLNHGYRTTVQKGTKYIMKENLLLLKDLLRPLRLRFTVM